MKDEAEGPGVTGDDFRRRIEEQYRRRTGEEGTHGALTWFGKVVGRGRRAVYRYCSSEVVGDDMPLVLLAVIEGLPDDSPWPTRPDALHEIPEGFPCRARLVDAGFRSEFGVWAAGTERILDAGFGARDVVALLEHFEGGTTKDAS